MFSFLLPLFALLHFTNALTSTLQQVTSFGSNPTNVGMYVYRPANITAASKPALIVAIHYCTGTGPAYFQNTEYAALADQFGFIVIYPSSPWSGTCWDVSSRATLTHNGGGDSNAIANMVAFAIANYGVDAMRVFVTGTSSGAMMTNVMCATYPNLFKAATVYSGVAAGCFFSNTGGVDAWNQTCSDGQVSATQSQWAAIAHAMFPEYTGAYPAIQEYHGTADTALFPENLGEEIKQWAGVQGYDAATPAAVLQNTPLSGYTKSVYGPKLQGILAQGVGHTVPVLANEDLLWFGIRTAPSNPGTVGRFGQCGGLGYQGPGCASPWTCTVLNDFFWQCL